MRRVASAAILAGLLHLISPRGAWGQEIFHDGFESGETCGWTVATDDDDSEATALVLASTTDCDATGVMTDGVLHGPADVDYTVHLLVDTELGCVLDPTVEVVAAAAVRLCWFASCLAGSTMIQCPTGSTAAVSPSGVAGCCTVQGSMQVDLNCETTDDSATIWTRVDQPAASCSGYSLDIHD